MVNRRSTSPIPEPILDLRRQLERFRSGQRGRTKLPESLWQAAVELARQYGVYPVARPLGLDYTRLKQRLGEIPARRRRTTGSAFVELVPLPHPVALEGCVIEFESSRGGKMRVQCKAGGPPDWASLLRAWREAEG
jgi:hypothetical protein